MISIIMGSDSDFPVVKEAVGLLKGFGVPFEVRVLSAHRTPDELREYVAQGRAAVYIAAAGAAAHLAGVIASMTLRPVIALPVQSGSLGGLDSLLAMVQMPPGVPVATVAINGGLNAALLAAQILATADEGLRRHLAVHRQLQVQKVKAKDQSVQDMVAKWA